MKFYIATAIERRAEQQVLKLELEKLGHECAYDWGVHGSVQDEGDARYLEVATNEAAGVAASDLVIVLLPGGRGTHTELGLAIGHKKDVVTIGTTKGQAGRDCVFYWHPRVVKRFESVLEFLAWIAGIYEKYAWSAKARTRQEE